ncbi:hypothetical protein J6590_017952 [Homalodisca vitripennis]|nr:hypothetical protein J6590_017952 [Homalodisca vitripennis]
MLHYHQFGPYVSGRRLHAMTHQYRKFYKCLYTLSNLKHNISGNRLDRRYIGPSIIRDDTSRGPTYIPQLSSVKIPTTSHQWNQFSERKPRTYIHTTAKFGKDTNHQSPVESVL